MRRNELWYIFFSSIFLFVLVLIFNSDFWNNVFLTPSFSLETAISILILALFTGSVIGILIWNKYQSNLKRKVLNQIEVNKIELGVSLGSITNEGLIIQGKSKSCPFNDFLLLSMLEYSAILYQHDLAKFNVVPY